MDAELEAEIEALLSFFAGTDADVSHRTVFDDQVMQTLSQPAFGRCLRNWIHQAGLFGVLQLSLGLSCFSPATHYRLRFALRCNWVARRRHVRL